MTSRGATGDASGARAEAIRQRLQGLDPIELEIGDDSHLHAGHASAGGAGHFRVRLVSARFRGLARVARHRLVYDLLSDLIPRDVHALALTLLAPDEAPSPAGVRAAAPPFVGK